MAAGTSASAEKKQSAGEGQRELADRQRVRRRGARCQPVLDEKARSGLTGGELEPPHRSAVAGVGLTGDARPAHGNNGLGLHHRDVVDFVAGGEGGVGRIAAGRSP